MKALVFVAAWVALGLAVAWRRPLGPADRVLAVLFWPFFLAGEAAPPAEGPVSRLAALLDAAPAHGGLADALRGEERRLASAIVRLEEARSVGGGARSAAVLDAALADARRDLERLRDLADLTAAQLLVAAQRAGGAEGVLADLRAHLAALSEVEGAAGLPQV